MRDYGRGSRQSEGRPDHAGAEGPTGLTSTRGALVSSGRALERSGVHAEGAAALFAGAGSHSAILEYIGVYYDRRRCYSTCDYPGPKAYERRPNQTRDPRPAASCHGLSQKVGPLHGHIRRSLRRAVNRYATQWSGRDYRLRARRAQRDSLVVASEKPRNSFSCSAISLRRADKNRW